MKAHNLSAIGFLRLQYEPAHPDDAVRKKDLENSVSPQPIFITDVEALGGNSGEKTYADTTPSDRVLLDCIVDTSSIRVHFIAEGGTFYSPTVTVDGTEVDFIEEVPNDFRLFQGYVDLNITNSGDVTIDSSAGSSATVNVTLSVDGPSVTAFSIDSLPGSQTEVKSGDTVSISGTVSNDATTMTVEDSGALSSGSVSLGADDSASTGFKTFTGSATVSGRSGNLSGSVFGTNSLGTQGDSFTSSTVTLNQTYPSISISVSNNNGLVSLAQNDTATVSTTVQNADSQTFSFDHGTYTGPSSGNYTVTVTSTTYDLGNNITMTATRNANGASTTENASVNVASAQATASLSIDGSPARLRSSPGGNVYTLRFSADQRIDSAPSVTLPVGTWATTWQQANNSTWTRDIEIKEGTAEYAVGNFTFTPLDFNNTAGLNTSATNVLTITVGGFEERTITFNAFAQNMPIGATVADATKTVASYSGQTSNLTFRTDKNNASSAYTILDGDNGSYVQSGGTYLWLNDTDFVGSNTSGTLQVTIEELV